MIKLIATDIDGTLLNHDQQLTERTERALKAAIEQGVRVILATGKTRFAGEGIIQKLGLTTPGIYLQGLSVHYHDSSIRHQMMLDSSVARRIITFAEDRGFEVAAYSGTRILVRNANSQARELSEKYGEPEPEVVGPLQNILGSTQINKLLIIKLNDPRKIKALQWQLSMQFGVKEAKLTQAGIIDMLEVLPPGASKGNTLKTLLKELDIKPEEVLAIGDAENDIEMIQLAGIGVAVGNATDKLKAVADYVVASNDDDGVAEAVERFVLKQDQPRTESEPTSNDTAQIGVMTPTDATVTEVEKGEAVAVIEEVATQVTAHREETKTE